LRAMDGSATAQFPYTARRSGSAGVWVPTPPAFAPASLPGWGRVTPWVMRSQSQFRVGPPPALDSDLYAMDVNEVKAIGAQNSGAAGTDLYDPANGKFSAAEDMTIGRHSHTATLLPDGTVLIAGGYSVWLSPNPGGSSSAELYVPRLLTPPLVVNDLRFDLTVVTAGASYSVNISGSGLIAETFFDVRFTSPGNNASVVLNWQRGPAASHAVPVGTASGNWTINGVRAHQIEEDHTSSFVPVSATITVSP